MTTSLVRIIAGDSVPAGDIVITLQQDGVAFDLTGATVLWKTRHRASRAAGSSTMTVQGAATLGKVSPVYTAAQTALLAVGAYDVQIEVTDSLGNVRTFPSADQQPITMSVSEGL